MNLTVQPDEFLAVVVYTLFKSELCYQCPDTFTTEVICEKLLRGFSKKIE